MADYKHSATTIAGPPENRIAMEMPIALRVLSVLGREPGIAALRAMVREAGNGNHGEAMDVVREACGNTIEINVDEDGATRIQSVIELRGGDKNAIYWDNEGLVIFGCTLPETVIASIPGRTVAHVVNAGETAHLGHLVVESAHGDEGALILDTPDCYVTIRELEDRVENR